MLWILWSCCLIWTHLIWRHRRRVAPAAQAPTARQVVTPPVTTSWLSLSSNPVTYLFELCAWPNQLLMCHSRDTCWTVALVNGHVWLALICVAEGALKAHLCFHIESWLWFFVRKTRLFCFDYCVICLAEKLQRPSLRLQMRLHAPSPHQTLLILFLFSNTDCSLQGGELLTNLVAIAFKWVIFSFYFFTRKL